MNLSHCRVCQGQNHILHSITESLPIHIWPLEKAEGHAIEDAGLYICQDCGHVQLQTLDEAFVASLYAEGSFVEDNLAMKKERLEIIQSSLGNDLFTQKQVLDVGGGHNPFVALLPESETWVVDIAPDEESEKHADHVMAGRFEEVELPASHFDVITVFHTLEHFSDPAPTVQQMARVVKSGGVVIVEVPNLLGVVESIPYYAVFHQHMSLFTPATMDHLFDRYGFRRKALLRSDGVILAAYEKAGGTQGLASHFDESARYATQLRTRLSEIQQKIDCAVDRWEGKRLGLYGAGGSTTLFLANYPKLRDKIEVAFDRDEKKHGRYIPGSRIPVHAPDDIDTAPIDLLFFLFTPLYTALSPTLSKECISLEQL